MASHKVNPGRNLPLATAVGLALLGLLIASLAFDRWWFAILVSVASALATRELRRMIESKGIRLTPLALIAVPVILLVSYWQGLGTGMIVLGIATLVGWIDELRRGVSGFVGAVTAYSFTLGYLGATLAFAMELARNDDGFGLVLSAVLLTVANDTGGYFAGILAGRHPMVPSISPKKSWEGFAGSLSLQMIIGGLVVPLLVPVSLWQGALAGFAMTFTGTAGDLVESAFKRDTGVKDSGEVLPGHGGMLDRIDALIVNVPVAWLIFVLVLGV